MAQKRFRKTHFFWLLPLLVLLVPVLALLAAPLFGVHWQGLGWRQGPSLDALWYESDGCRQVDVHGARLSGLWPLTLTLDTVGVHDCPDDGTPFRLPSLPPVDITVWALQYQDYPPLMAHLSQAGGRWRGRTEFRGSELEAEYRRDRGRWRFTGDLQAAPFAAVLGSGPLTGGVRLQGDGQWLPGQRFQGKLVALGRDLGVSGQGPRGDLTVRARWHNDYWRVRAALDEPLALGGGWVVSPGRDLIAEGRGLALSQADGRLVVNGPWGRAALALSSDAERFGEGQGRLLLSEGWRGRLDVDWRDGQLRLAPFQVSLPEPAVTLRLREPATLPLALEGEAILPLEAVYQDLTLTTSDSRVYWRPNDVQWRGGLNLTGQWGGYRLTGQWQGDAGPTGVHGEPARVRLSDADLDVTATLPLDGVTPPHWPLAATLEGRYQSIPFRARADARLDGDTWSGALNGRGGPLPELDGGVLTLDGRWDYADRPRLLAGATVKLSRAVRERLLIRPINARLTTPLVLDDDGPHGHLSLDGEGLVAERWTLPPVTGDAHLDGDTFGAELRVPAWQTQINLSGRARTRGYAGTLSGVTPLAPAMSRGLPFTFQGGDLNLEGNWRWAGSAHLDGRLTGHGLDLDWGSVQARGLDAELALGWDDGAAALATVTPLTLASLDVGVPITDLRLDLDSDLNTWTVRRAHARVLGGEIRTPGLSWPSPAWQPVVVTQIELSRLAALQGEPAVALSGRVGGYVPLRLLRDSIAVRQGRLANETPLSLSILPSSGAQAMAQSNRAVSIALEALNPLRIQQFQAGVDMAADGWLDAAVRIQGVNPQRNGLPVVFNYTHRENVLELLRSLRIGDRITDQVMTESKR
ncbi:YdbH domain-containing protein [Alloalcanivorax marinus]|uniref:YdbH domain-containing protein n=1 Tax=Alloalcanivorax marinus TaxID=1177169 RepID=UPI001934362B|nr:YdbH domain-containing protein [Alloalcanivorax marinus]MBL7250048.1 YdbH domain-containing protein [Alloalcanivorax marinus]